MMKRNVSLLVVLCAMVTLGASGAVVQRTAKTATARAPISRTPVSVAATQTTVVETEPEPEIVEPLIIENKSSQFDVSLDSAMANGADLAGTDLAEQIRIQRAALDAADRISFANTNTSTCDKDLRQCMSEQCGGDFTRCASDTDTMFGTKLDTCRRSTKCNANEFKLFSAEIKSDRAANIQLKSFNNIIKCGNDYDTCIINQCGTTYSKCLGKSAGDAAIAKCASIARECASSDNGLTGRMTTVFGTLRENAEEQISADEKKLYSLREQMKSVCGRLGAMFDERTLDCVYTINFYAGGNSTLFASKKAYAGSTFDCTPNWFGVDVTTYMENADRLTRSQTSASGAMLGSGVGMAVGAVTSGAISNAIDSQAAERAQKQAECEGQEGYKWNNTLKKCVKDKSVENAQKSADSTKKSEQNKAQTKATREQRGASKISESQVNEFLNKLSTSEVQENEKPVANTAKEAVPAPAVPAGDYYKETDSKPYTDAAGNKAWFSNIQAISSSASESEAREKWRDMAGKFIVWTYCTEHEGYLLCGDENKLTCVGDNDVNNTVSEKELRLYCENNPLCGYDTGANNTYKCVSTNSPYRDLIQPEPKQKSSAKENE